VFDRDSRAVRWAEVPTAARAAWLTTQDLRLCPCRQLGGMLAASPPDKAKAQEPGDDWTAVEPPDPPSPRRAPATRQAKRPVGFAYEWR